ncbi:AraC family transcriptional regulator [Cohnella fermenti]|nr:AraC family transcriptional regulator [Cohnella fermenti]
MDPLIDKERNSEAGPREALSASSEDHHLLVATESGGWIAAGGAPRPFARGRCLLLPPGARIEWLPTDASAPPCKYWVQFKVEQDDAGLFASPAELRFEPLSRLEADLRELLSPGGDNGSPEQPPPEDGLARFHRHIRFQAILYELLAQQSAGRQEPESDPAIEQIISYLHQAYSEEIEFDRLAQEANLSRWQYDRMFRTITGQSPARYLSAIRIEEAKKLLASSSLRVGEIASRVGFRDEFYFSRRFRQSTGLSPSEYQASRQGPRIISIQYLGELLALGIRPIGTNSAMFAALPEAADAVRGFDEPYDIRALSELRPDLILYPSYIERQVAERLSRIATAVEIDWSADVYTRMLRLGELLGKAVEAKQWIAAYEEKAKNARRRLQGIAGDGETATAFVYHSGDLYVYAGHHFGHTLYRGIGFKPTRRVQAIMEQDRNAKWVRIEPSELPEYAGDRVFLALPETGFEGERGRKLLNHSGWYGLPAVTEGRAYVMSDMWANYNPITLEKHLDEIVCRLIAD